MNLLKTAATVSGLTLISRITGLAREVLTASIFGAGAQTDAFFVAFRLPNLLRRLFAEGAFSQAFVPVLGQVKAKEGNESARRLATRVGLLLFLALSGITVLAITAAPVLVWLMTGGFSGDQGRFDLTVSLTQWMFPYIVMISLVALAAGVLNTWSEFRVPAFTPVLLNLAFIAAALLLAPRLSEPIWALATAVLIGGIAQLSLQAWALWRRGLLADVPGLMRHPLLAIQETWQDPMVRRILTLMLPATLAVSVAQVSLVINTHIAARLETGSVSWLSYADRLMEFPTALLGVALGTVLLPSLTRAHALGSPDRVSALIDWGLRLVVVLAIPAAVGLAILAEPLTASLFHYGAFTTQDMAMTGAAMQAYAVGLLGLVAVKVLAPGFYAQQDIRTPVKIALATLVLTQLLNLMLVPVFDHAGLALATGVAACFNALILWWRLRARGSYRAGPGWVLVWLKVILASAVMGAVCFYAADQIDWAAAQAEPAFRIVALCGILALAVLVYFASLSLVRLPWRRLLKPPEDLSATPIQEPHP
ncbi:MAG: murein biosynthesis integral rane protein MurJ [Pseudomonadota bacterium]